MLSVHGAKHFWERLNWLLDVAELTAGQPVDWHLTIRIAAKLKSTRLLLLGLYLAHELMDAPLPQIVPRAGTAGLECAMACRQSSAGTCGRSQFANGSVATRCVSLPFTGRSRRCHVAHVTFGYDADGKRPEA